MPGKSTPMPELKLKISFAQNRKVHFVLFCMAHLIKNIRNALFRNGNDYHYPKLVLSAGFVLESGVCLAKWMRDLHYRNKNQIMSSMRMAKNAAYVDSLSKQKASPALALFSREMTTALDNEHKGLASGTSNFLKMINNCVMQPLLNVSLSKGYKIKEAMVFFR